MLFNSLGFLFVFLPLSLLLILSAQAVSLRAFLAVLSGASLFFYGFFKPEYTLLLVGSALGNYIAAGLIGEGRNRPVFVGAIIANLLLLAYFKYTNFLIDSASRLLPLEIKPVDIVLPLAISFITFEQIAFLSDVHSGRIARGSLLRYFAFITFFPKLIAGPIIRYTELAPQLDRAPRPRGENVIFGLCLFCIGLIKKVALADVFAAIADPVFAKVASGLKPPAADAAGAVLAFALQIYFDFSAYSEMALGIALMMGVRLPLNFLSPYKATSIIDFWRRWHITLSAFLRDYVYVPLGGNRVGLRRRYANLMIVMLIGGLWHGAAWTFVVWGGIHGAALAANHLWRSAAPSLGRFGAFISSRIVAWLLTMSVVLLAWVYFRAPDFRSADRIFLSLTGRGAGAPTLDGAAWLYLALGWTIVLTMPNVPQLFALATDPKRVDWRAPLRLGLPRYVTVATAAVAFCLSVILLSAGKEHVFIYFQF
jgi:D-alanyl-lipoteichoic acid acyltransferase DltB (MBOAT superfamily)